MAAPIKVPLSNAEFWAGDAREVLAQLPERSVHVVVTSPPYCGLRDYKGPLQIWGGRPDCDHQWNDKSLIRRSNDQGAGEKQSTNRGGLERDVPAHYALCPLCGAWQGALGLEPTPDLYVQHLVEIINAAGRVLRDDGVLWLNLGDSHAGYWGDAKARAEGRPSDADTNGWTNGFSMNARPSFAEAFRPGAGRANGQMDDRGQRNRNGISVPSGFGIKPLDLVGIPWSVAFALRASGWYLRSDCIWFKRNPMPESVNGWRWEQHRIKTAPVLNDIARWLDEEAAWRTIARDHDQPVEGAVNHLAGGQTFKRAEWVDCPGCKRCAPNGGLVLRKGSWRPTRGHEYIFMLTKTDDYFCDLEAIREPMAESSLARISQANFANQTGGDKDYSNGANPNRSARKTVEAIARKGTSGGRNRRSVWAIPSGDPLSIWEFATQPYKGDHYAAFPEALPEIALMASTSEKGVCPECGAPWARVVHREAVTEHDGATDSAYETGTTANRLALLRQAARERGEEYTPGATTIGWRPTCRHLLPPIPATVLDPFLGSGTTAAVAKKRGLYCIGIDLKLEYLGLAIQRYAEAHAPEPEVAPDPTEYQPTLPLGLGVQ